MSLWRRAEPAAQAPKVRNYDQSSRLAMGASTMRAAKTPGGPFGKEFCHNAGIIAAGRLESAQNRLAAMQEDAKEEAMPKHHYLEGFDFTLPPEAFEPASPAPGRPSAMGGRDLPAAMMPRQPHRYFDFGRKSLSKERTSSWRMAGGHGDWSSPWRTALASPYASWSYSYEKQGAWSARMAPGDAVGTASLAPSRPSDNLGESRPGWIFVQTKALPSAYDKKKGQREASLIYRLARSLAIAKKSMEKLALGEGAWALGAAPQSTQDRGRPLASAIREISAAADIEILPPLATAMPSSSAATMPKIESLGKPKPGPILPPPHLKERAEEPDRSKALNTRPADALAAAKAIEQRDLSALMLAVPRGAPWPASAPWMLAACAACHDWPAGIAFAKALGHPLDGAGSDGLSPMDWAVARGSWSSAVALLRAGARPGDALAPSLAKLGAPLEVFAVAVERGADVNARDERGMSAIHWAAARGSREWAEALVRARARLDSLDAEGRKAKDVAKAHKNYELSHYLQREGFRGRT